MNNLGQILDFPLFGAENGSLSVLKGNGGFEVLPFDIKRVLLMKDMNNRAVRGGHTHHKTRQVLFVVSGSCKVDLDNGKEKSSVILNKFNQGLLLEPYVWHVMKDFENNTVLLVLADSEYDEKDYIRNYDEFLKLVK